MQLGKRWHRLELFMEMFLAKGNENIIVYAYYGLKVS